MEDQDRNETFNESDDEDMGFWWIDAPGNPEYITLIKIPEVMSTEFMHAFYRSCFGLGIRLWDKPSAEELKELLQGLLAWVDEGGLDRMYD